jgi:hypothetical protein
MLRAWALLLLVDWELRLLPFSRVQERGGARCRAVNGLDPAAEAVEIERLQRLVAAAARNHLYPMTCLRQSVLLQRLLSRKGIAAELRFGVRKTPAGLAAHAWLERGGRAIGERADVEERFQPLGCVESGRLP